MNFYVSSSAINIFKSLLKPSHNIESVLSFSIFLTLKSAIVNPLDLTRLRVSVPYNLVFLFNEGPVFFLGNVSEIYAMLARHLQQPVIIKILTGRKQKMAEK